MTLRPGPRPPLDTGNANQGRQSRSARARLMRVVSTSIVRLVPLLRKAWPDLSPGPIAMPGRPRTFSSRHRPSTHRPAADHPKSRSDREPGPAQSMRHRARTPDADHRAPTLTTPLLPSQVIPLSRTDEYAGLSGCENFSDREQVARKPQPSAGASRAPGIRCALSHRKAHAERKSGAIRAAAMRSHAILA